MARDCAFFPATLWRPLPTGTFFFPPRPALLRFSFSSCPCRSVPIVSSNKEQEKEWKKKKRETQNVKAEAVFFFFFFFGGVCRVGGGGRAPFHLVVQTRFGAPLALTSLSVRSETQEQDIEKKKRGKMDGACVFFWITAVGLVTISIVLLVLFLLLS